ncbi:homocysteine S-methyltransferase family protein [Pelagibacterium halotolerans]|uniref:Putative homocysteine S-methyltransferase n=1 Tax=Pelagibacterium halotolerans (strain DSM 22347 / JCM 15775 / CGMCC 1.7692 / B2) TaxID=1082931 RepID=G4RFX2_PELHB|nr:homocysteine S-methyltransferase family protein [Pelagibacterium halotolerans]AEQ51015.1 putative homocysteine S-methyltransferase [Pelagibacterium halotolerans B2]QJR19094.1 homocysteine methyltransferase [Pelagibacterium halotolerans]SEA02563.1 homocysteine S-methyltransferase [Pelagibacterium halotolerans]
MSKYRQALPQADGRLFLSDGGMETALIFLQGVDLPQFAAFVLLESESGRAELVRYYEKFLPIARDRGVGFLLDTATWRASLDWGRSLGFDADRLTAVNIAAVELIAGLRGRWETPTTPIVLNGAIGPRGDGYKAGRMDVAEARDYHAFQVGIFAGTQVDMVSAITMNTVNEAVGIALAAKAADVPCVVSFTVETDGKLVDGTTLRAAIEATEEATGASPAYYMVNCAHPTHFEQALERDEAWVGRIRGIRANASAKSHSELDDSDTLDIGDIVGLSGHYKALTSAFPSMRVLGGCCGTDHRHLAAIGEAVAPN